LRWFEAGTRLILIVVLVRGAVLLFPPELIHNSYDSRGTRRNLTGMPCFFLRSYDPTKSNRAMIAIDRYRVSVSDSIFGQIALHLGYQQVIFRTVGRRLIVVAGRCLQALILA